LVAVMDQPPAAFIQEMYNSEEGYAVYVAAQRVEDLKRRHMETIDRLTKLLPYPVPDCTLFDVGAGAGGFLALARAAGFRVQGNEISKPAAQECFRRHGISLTNGSLGGELGESRFEAVTMWCVLAHVSDPRQLLTDALRLLKPGGMLYFHTPRWCAIDLAGLAAIRISRGRIYQITERRVNAAHLRLYDHRNLRRLLAGIGFDVVDMRAIAGYSLQAASYLGSLGVPGRLARPTAYALDNLIKNDLCIRNTLDVYVRKPARGHGASSSGHDPDLAVERLRPVTKRASANHR
jgi:2-polyprenyl-3-methyl-5-hydroxy-6-metoxy-1,4-benzoquinol methylase